MNSFEMYDKWGNEISHYIYAGSVTQAANYFVDFMTGKFNEEPSLRMLSGHNSLEEFYEEEEGEALVSVVISVGYDDSTSGYLLQKRLGKWSTRGVWVRRTGTSNTVWRLMTPEERKAVGKGLIWKMPQPSNRYVVAHMNELPEDREPGWMIWDSLERRAVAQNFATWQYAAEDLEINYAEEALAA